MSEKNDFGLFVTEDNVKSFPLHKHERTEILYYLSGNGVLKTDEKDIPFSAGKIIAVPAGVLHGSASDGYFKNVCINFEFEGFKATGAIEIADTPEGSISSLIKIIYYYYYIDREICRDLVKSLKAMILRQSAAEGEHLMWVENVYLEIRERFTDCDFDIKKCIESTHYSDDYFRTKFKSVYGIAPVQFLNELRIERAYTLLTSQSETSVSEVARACGFSDPLYFSRMYKRFRGHSPTEERNKRR